MVGGGTQQFAAIPYNLCGNGGDKQTADFVVTGTWSVKAVEEANKYLNAHEVANVKVSAAVGADKGSRLHE
jgi:phosphoserine aminotransferase